MGNRVDGCLKGDTVDFIDLKTQYRNLKPFIDERIHAVLDHGQYILGPEIGELESRLALLTRSKSCVSCSSGTDALTIALLALGVEAGDEIITTPFSFVATVESIALLGAKPVFVDVDSRTYNMDTNLLERAITPRTKAIMPVSLYGQCADMQEINQIASIAGIAVIEDAAQSFGASYRGEMSCNLSTIGCTSFFPSKPLGCYGDGGACFTNDDHLALRMRQIRAHGQDRRYHHPIVGINGRMDTLQAAILLAKMDTFVDEIAARGRVASVYDGLLQNVVQVPHIESWNTSVYAQYTIQTEDRKSLQEALKMKGIPTAVHYPVPLHLQPAFASTEFPCGSMPVAEAAADRVLSLPMHPFLERSQQEQVASATIQALAGLTTCLAS